MSERARYVPTTRRGELEMLVLEHPSGSRAEIAVQGAHVVSFVPAGGSEALFLSERSAWQPGTAIRGGIPVIFPQFAGLGPLPKHGFARTARWEPIESTDGPRPRVSLLLRDSETTRATWPHTFVTELTATLHPRAIEVTLSVVNAGAAPFTFTAALHTYLRVGDVREASIEGLHGKRFRSAVEGVDGAVDDERELGVSGELDRTYFDVPSTLLVHDRSLGRDIRLVSDGFPDAVIWNPWIEKARALPDMAPEGHLRMLCVEAACVGTPTTLAPDTEWRGTQRIEL